MSLGAIGSMRFIEITLGRPVQRRLRAVETAVRAIQQSGDHLPFTHPAVQKIADQLTEEERAMPAVYLAFGGDYSTAAKATRSKTFVAFDQLPIFNYRVTEELAVEHYAESGFMNSGKTLEELLFHAAKTRQNHFQNEHLLAFSEIGMFLFLDVISCGGRNIRVFEAQDNHDLFKIVFDLNKETHRVYLVKETLRDSCMQELLQGIIPGSVILKGGIRAALGTGESCYESYIMLNSIADNFPEDTLIITDLDMKELLRDLGKPLNPALHQVPFSFGERHVFLGYPSGCGAYLYRVRA